MAFFGYPEAHDNEPWEWDGVLGIPTDSPKDMDGVPRQVYQDVSVYNQLIPMEPKANHIYPIGQPVAIRVNVAAPPVSGCGPAPFDRESAGRGRGARSGHAGGPRARWHLIGLRCRAPRAVPHPL